jgi:restriction system protein
MSKNLRQGERRKEEGAQFVKYFGPLLDALRGLGGSGTPDEVIERIAQDHRIPDEVQNELLPSGEPRFRNQVHWARFYLVREGLLDSSKRCLSGFLTNV